MWTGPDGQAVLERELAGVCTLKPRSGAGAPGDDPAAQHETSSHKFFRENRTCAKAASAPSNCLNTRYRAR